jgi:hypothetical protein
MKRDIGNGIIGATLGLALALGATSGCGGEACYEGQPDCDDVESKNSALSYDGDNDGVGDSYEDDLARKWAPEIHLSPSSKDWTRPANVDWYLARVRMRFHQVGCPDDQLLNRGYVTQSNIYQQRERRRDRYWFCTKSGSYLYSKDSHPEFFLQPPSDSVHAGSSSSSQWKAYVHVRYYPSGVSFFGAQIIPAQSYVIQYWLFYPYNDSYGSINHEGDWERVTVVTNRYGSLRYVYLSQHEGAKRYTHSQLGWNGNHPIVYSADGSHANYPSVGSFTIPNVPSWFKDHTYSGGPVWRTWNNFVNVGEKNAPLHGQNFIRYGGRWGEIGTTDVTSGPVGPAFKIWWSWY